MDRRGDNGRRKQKGAPQELPRKVLNGDGGAVSVWDDGKEGAPEGVRARCGFQARLGSDTRRVPGEVDVLEWQVPARERRDTAMAEQRDGGRAAQFGDEGLGSVGCGDCGGGGGVGG